LLIECQNGLISRSFIPGQAVEEEASYFLEGSQCKELPVILSFHTIWNYSVILSQPPQIVLSHSLPLSLSYLASYSALKKDGQRLSTLMKRGEVVEAKPARPVTVYSISLQKFQPPFFTLGKMEKFETIGIYLYLYYIFG
jgi:hypothetical protein